MCRPPSSGRARRRACGLPHPASGQRSRPSVALHVCVLTGAPWRRRPGPACRFTCPSIPRRRLTVQRCPMGGGGGDSRPIVRGPMAVAFPSRAPPVPSTPTVLGAPLPAMLMSAGGDGVRHRPEMAPGPPGDRPYLPLRAPTSDPTPITQVKVRTRAKSITGFSLSEPVPGFKTGYRFSGSRLTSLISIILLSSTKAEKSNIDERLIQVTNVSYCILIRKSSLLTCLLLFN